MLRADLLFELARKDGGFLIGLEPVELPALVEDFEAVAAAAMFGATLMRRRRPLPCLAL